MKHYNQQGVIEDIVDLTSFPLRTGRKPDCRTAC
jgi:hypothetical protein